jgi:potassium-transporting ATPase KdpC subunit
MKEWRQELRATVTAVVSLAVIVGGLYPLAVWVLSQVVFPSAANGSWIVRSGEIIGSRLIGQAFTGPGYFHSRPSAAGDGYNPLHSEGSNLGPTSKRLVELVTRRVAAYRAENGLPAEVSLPADAVTASASGLDPHISPENARLQAPRVAEARGLTEAEIRRLIEAATEGRELGIFGEPRVNILLLNLALDGAAHGGR